MMIILTDKGLMASQIHEVHSVILTDVISSVNLITYQLKIISVSSIFTSIRLSEDDSYLKNIVMFPEILKM